MNQLREAKKGNLTPEMIKVAKEEGLDPEFIGERMAKGQIIIPKNIRHNLRSPKAIGAGVRTKINTNLGTSTDYVDLNYELKKLKVAIEAGTDTVMDLSTGGDLDKIRRSILKSCPLPVGTVPIYQAAIESISEKKALIRMTKDKIFEVIQRQGEDGVDFITVHCGLTRMSLERLKKEGRLTDIVSRGGAFLTTWMIANDEENPLYEEYDRLLEIAKKYDLTLSLGDGLRPGCLADSTDRAQVQELILLGELAKRAYEEDVQVMIEGPGHIPLSEIRTNVLLEKKLCHNAPFYVLGPVVTDIAPGYDHITSAIGGAYAASSGADFLCYVTAAEHLRLPTVEDVREGVVVTRIAAHIGDIAKGIKGAMDWDIKMAKARKKRDWQQQIRLAIDPNLARKMREESKPHISDVCTMCGEYCALKLVEKALKPE
ncbi:phosphomethylpyrimidine synthase [Candidatus Aerophobetes bacterium]|uniref:Phosphomethylpyrimidine synthase n=1 Tax=Aerophobetes bacterium TaxID=2030807 RepID=A0A497E5U2_UNCAE|nr:MAG: phosphomethylpyrimidine synthase [Candidatus Aerophobetes bacterium]